MQHARSRIRLEVEVVDESNSRELGHVRSIQCYGLPEGWTPADVHDLFLDKGLKPEDRWTPAAEAVPPFWRQGKGD